LKQTWISLNSRRHLNRSANMLTKPIPSTHFLLGLLAAASLAACAGPRVDDQHQHHAGQSAAGSSGMSAQGGTMGGAMTGKHTGCGMMGAATAANQSGCPMMGGSEAASTGAMQATDKGALCSMYRGMRDAPDDQARQAMMDRLMPGMSPEMRQRHMEMMRQQCQ
jgi:hypothetical protein